MPEIIKPDPVLILPYTSGYIIPLERNNNTVHWQVTENNGKDQCGYNHQMQGIKCSEPITSSDFNAH
jgi:hypothetical protein